MRTPSASQGRSTRSSGTTPNPGPDPRVWIVLACEDAPKLCTGRRAIRFGLAEEATAARRPPMKTLLLDPHAILPVSRLDSEVARDGGVVAVDCSWNRLARRGGYPLEDGWLGALRYRRRLPLLLAANPQHFGRIGEMNTAEALGTALYLVAGPRVGHAFLEKFSFGLSFLDLNHAVLEQYRRATTPQEVEHIEGRAFGGPAGVEPRVGSGGSGPAPEGSSQ